MPRRKFSDEFKREAVELTKEPGVRSEKKKYPAQSGLTRSVAVAVYFTPFCLNCAAAAAAASSPSSAARSK